MGEFKKPNRSRVTHDADSPMRSYMAVDGRVTVRELVAYMEENHPHIDPFGVELNFATAVWEDYQTDQEREQYRRHLADRERRTEEWERQTYERLKAKFG